MVNSHFDQTAIDRRITQRLKELLTLRRYIPADQETVEHLILYQKGGHTHRVAYAALKHEYEKKGDKRVRKAEKMEGHVLATAELVGTYIKR